MRMIRNTGYTLIELMIVVTIISIIAAIALPAYDGYVRRGNRVLAKAALNEIASKQESFFMERKSYSLTLAGLSNAYSDPMYIDKSGNPTSSQSTTSLYKVELVSPTAVSFTIKATALNVQTKDTGCTELRLTNLGQRYPSSGDCWTR